MKVKYTCSFCGKEARRAWRCSNCGYLACTDCSKGGKSTALGKIVRLGAGAVTLGGTEVLRAGYRKASQKCPRCESGDIISV
jgi:hypothetical protein